MSCDLLTFFAQLIFKHSYKKILRKLLQKAFYKNWAKKYICKTWVYVLFFGLDRQIFHCIL